MNEIEKLKELNSELERLNPRPAGFYNDEEERLMHSDGGEALRSRVRENEQLLEVYENLFNKYERASFISHEIKNAITETESML